MKEEKDNIRIIDIDGVGIRIDLDNMYVFEDLIPVRCFDEISNNKYITYSVILNKNFEVVVPLRDELVSKEDINNFMFEKDILIYQGKKAIYFDKDACYLIDLNTVKFNKIGDDYKPSGYLLKAESVYNIGDGKVIFYLTEKAFIYDVVNNKFMSNIYDYINVADNLYIAYYFFENENINPTSISIYIDKDYNLIREAIIHDMIRVLIPGRFNKKEIIKYADSCINEYYNSFKDEKCKRIIQ